jgi:Ni,Fe-hydrogenase I cytochrome b subunit
MTTVANGDEVVYRHSAVIRLTHWLAVLCVTLLFLSGLQIFNAHPALYLGQQSILVDAAGLSGPRHRQALALLFRLASGF